MILVIIAGLILCLFAWFWTKWSKVKRYWSDRNVPHFPPHPVWGSLTFLQKENPAYFFQRIYDAYKLKAPYAGMWLFWQPCLVVNCPELAKKVLVKDGHLFRDRFARSGKSDPIGAANLFCVKDPLWTSVRRRLSPVFTASKLRAVHNHITEKSKELIQRIHMEMNKEVSTDLRHMYADYTTDVIGGAVFGIKGDATLTGDSPIRGATRSLMKYSWYRNLELSSIFFLPQIVNFFGFNFFPKPASMCMKKLFRTVVEQTGGYEKDRGKDPKDFMDALIKMKQDAEKENDTDITEDVLVAQGTVFLQAGFDSNAVTLSQCTYELAYDLEAQERLYQEVLERKRSLGGKDFEAKDLAGLNYLNGVIYEVLRKYVPVPFLDRLAKEDYKIDDNLTIPAGTPVYVNVLGMHWDPDLFPEPMKFVPERFLPENESNIKPFTYMPFGEGPRYCIGKRFAIQTIRYGLSTVILKYKFRPLPNTPIPNDAKMDNNAILFLPGEPLYVQFIPRDP